MGTYKVLQSGLTSKIRIRCWDYKQNEVSLLLSLITIEVLCRESEHTLVEY